jgi:hypothetical protein
MFDAKTRGQSALADAVTALFANIQVGELWNTAEGAVSNAIGKQDYAAVLRLFNNKGLVNQVSSLFGLQPKGLREYFLRSLQSGDAAVISAVRNRAPKIPALH